MRQTGGRGQYGDAVISLEPNPGEGYEFVNKITGGVIPREYISSVDAGHPEAMESGILAGYPVVDVKVDADLRLLPRRRLVRDGVQGRRLDGVQGRACRKADPTLLEPVFEVEVETPEEYMGDVIGDLILAPRPDPEHGAARQAQIIKARVPLSEMFGYATSMRSMSQGRATYTMQFAQLRGSPQGARRRDRRGSLTPRIPGPARP